MGLKRSDPVGFEIVIEVSEPEIEQMHGDALHHGAIAKPSCRLFAGLVSIPGSAAGAPKASSSRPCSATKRGPKRSQNFFECAS